MKHLALLSLCLWLTGCDSCGVAINLPGDEVMGTFSLHAEGTSKSCSLPDIQQTLDFPASLSRNRDGGQVFFFHSTRVWDAGFDGQFITSSAAALFKVADADGGDYCAPCRETETLNFRFAVLSRSQSKAVGEMCPPNPLDGGVPGADDDAGIKLPASTDAGFDAVRVCGELQVTIDGTGTGFCNSACNGCVLNYRLIGQRQ